MSNPSHSYQAWLERFAEDCGATSGTIHLLDGGELQLKAAVRIPEKVQAVVALIPKGKGMAGLAWERDRPVSTCNLKTDATGDVRPGAKAVDARAAVALPIHHADGSFRGVVGLAFMEERQLDEDELAQLQAGAEHLT